MKKLNEFGPSLIDQCGTIMEMIEKMGYDNSNLTISELIRIKNQIIEILENPNQDNTSGAGFQDSISSSDGLSGFRG